MFKNTRTLVGDLTQAQKGLLDGSLLGCIGCRLLPHLRGEEAGPQEHHRHGAGSEERAEAGHHLGRGDCDPEGNGQPELAQKLLKHVVSKESGHILSLLDTTCNVVTNKAVEELYTPEDGTSCRPTTCGMPGTIPRCTASRRTSTRCLAYGRKNSLRLSDLSNQQGRAA